MKVKVKEGHVGFIYGILRKEGEEFTLKDIVATATTEDDDQIVIKAEDQFSKVWMTKLEPKKAKPGPKPKVKQED